MHRLQGSPNEKVRLAVIGCGGIGRYLYHVFTRHAGNLCEVVAIADPYRKQLDEFQAMARRSFDAYSDYRRILERKDIDAVIVSTPDHWHARITIDACEAGKHVYVEKPASHNVAEGLAMVHAAREHKRVVMVGLQQRSGEHFQEAVEIVRSGKLGKITMVHCWNMDNESPEGIGNPPDSDPPPGLDWDMWLGPAPKRPYNPNRCIYHFRWFWDYAGGKVTDWGVHLIDIAVWAMGDHNPIEVAATGGKFALRDNRETPDTVECLFRFKDWLLIYSHRAANGFPANGRGYGTMFFGTNGSLYVNRDGLQVHPEKERIPAYQRGGSLQSEPHTMSFLRAIREGTPLACDILTGVRSSIIPMLANIAYHTRRTIRWDPQKAQIIGDKEANALLARPWRAPWGIPKRYIKPIG
ncbi:MAG: Gfo/Idh/MocA family oxidoreductase [Armatimonadota bacterium]